METNQRDGMSPAESPLDRTHLANMCGDDKEFERELLQEFLLATPQLVADLGKAIEDQNWKTVEMCAHTLKGSCRSLGANPLSDPCEVLENQSRAGRPDEPELVYKQITERFETLCEHIQETWGLNAA